MRNTIPDFLQPFLWSYDLSKIDMKKHKKIIVKNILDFGTVRAVDWLKENYTENEIKEVIAQTIQTEWSKKSIHLWSFIYNSFPKKTRF